MFSYGMVLFELLSGRRPTLGQHQLQIAKKLSKGLRPVLGKAEEVQFWCLHRLMTECWDTKPEKVSLPLSLREIKNTALFLGRPLFQMDRSWCPGAEVKPYQTKHARHENKEKLSVILAQAGRIFEGSWSSRSS